ncbi:MAG: ribosome biogenesis GTPase YlqF [Ruminococcaceae bacterium]|nr:ribosome biogenesis GTPase YlqF [Oscillospiraceae bacterium]
MPSNVIQWFPGHMAKTRRLMQECLSSVDLSIEILDARIPASSKNPEIEKLLGGKPVLTLLSKASMADPIQTEAWVAARRKAGAQCLPYDAVSGEGINALMPAIRTLLSEKLARYAEKGMTGRRIRAMVVGIPNVGKSTFINHMAGSKKAKAENRPGVTVTKQWVSSPLGLDLLDMPGVLWPKFDDPIIGENLAITGAIKDSVLNIDEIAMLLCGRLRERYPALFAERYKLTDEEMSNLDLYDLFLAVGRHRGFLMSGGVIDEERTAKALLEEFRNAKIGRITLESPKGE